MNQAENLYGKDRKRSTENVPPVYEAKTSYHTVCNDCQQTIDGIADAHIKDTGHSGYSTNVPITGEVLVSDAWVLWTSRIPPRKSFPA